ncbi:nuclear transcription factor Y subunit B-3 [Elaeis guineensis]|uniref:Nuclear transcription factor Y subunit B-3 n=1 Tax=Elaeis guineensis var. tenera TaxID=51953 RepID=A0A6I9QBU2_ELAGV|nr:nuclear transcription factor Y subunit B-3 [Elaeis guineensis]
MPDSDNESGGQNNSHNNNVGEYSSSREQDRFLPIANVSRIMKKALPANAKISKDAKETVQECVSEFISFITGEAADKCQREKRKTINGDDLLWAMTTLGFEDYVDPLKVYLHRFREMEGDKCSAGASASSQPQHKDGGDGGGGGGGGAPSMGNNVVGLGGGGGGAGGMMMMMGQQMYATPPSYHHHMSTMSGKSSMGGGSSASSSSPGFGRQGRV